MRLRHLVAAVIGIVAFTAGPRARPATAPTLTIDTPMPVPAWALAERELLRVNAEGVDLYSARFVDARGHMKAPEHWGVSDGPDDLMENIRNWPLAHALGGPDSILDRWKTAWEGHLDQFTAAKIPQVEAAKDGIYYKEFITSFDWEHNSEWLGPFYFYGLSRPDDAHHTERTRKFAGLYMNEDPDAPNYDAQHHIIRSLFNGSRGPKLTPATADDWDGPAAPGTDPESPRRTRFRNASNIRGDHPLNLNVANLVFHAYLLTHDAKYREWVLEYVDAWADRIRQAGGNIPSNIGLDGRIGSEWDGKWYRGVFGWNSPDEGVRNYVLRGPGEAFGAALLLTGDQKYAQVIRRQIDNLYAAKRVENGEILLPRYYGDQGWYGYAPLTGGPSGALGNLPNVMLNLYLWSFSPDDLARLPAADAPRARHHPDMRWIAYLQGHAPDYPLTALRESLDEMRRTGGRLTGASTDRRAAATPRAAARGRAENAPRRNGPSLTANPVATTALINLTMGASDPGGSTHGPTPLYAQVRHFDPDAHRAGLPPDVGALVEAIRANEVVLTLVNTNPLQARTMTVQMGAYGEHQATTVRIGDRTVAVNAPFFTVRLQPGAGATLTIGMRRFVNVPTLAFPWDPNRLGASAGTAPGTDRAAVGTRR